MITGFIIAFIIWAIWVMLAMVTLTRYQRIDYPKVAILGVILVGLGISFGYLFS